MITSPVVKPMTGPVVKGLIGSAGGGISTPDDVSGLVLWLDASDRGSTSDQWDDKSGQDNHFTKAGTGTFPTFSGGVATFNGTSDYLTGPSFSSLTAGECFALIARANNNSETGANTGSFHAFGDAGATTHYVYLNLIYDDFGGGTRYSAGDPSPDVSQYRIINVHSAANDWGFKMDGDSLRISATHTVSFNSTSSAIGASAITGGYFFDGGIKAYLLYNRKLTATERSGVYNYLDALR